MRKSRSTKYYCGRQPGRSFGTPLLTWLMLGLVLTLVISQSAVSVYGYQSQPRAAGEETIEALQMRIRTALNDDAFSTGRWGIKIVSVDSARTVFETDPDKLFMPASNMKLYTTATALDRLGPDFRTRTSVYAAAEPVKGLIKGDLILYGRGDGNLSARFNEGNYLKPLEDLADQLVARGVKRIQGNIVGDDSYFDSPPLGFGWEWDDLQWGDGAEVSALTIDDNIVNIKVTPGAKVGEPALLTASPATSYVTIINRLRTTAAGQRRELGVHRGLADNTIEIWGGIPHGDKGVVERIAVHNPALYAANLFKDVLVHRGIQVSGQPRSVSAQQSEPTPHGAEDPKGLLELASLTSIPLSEEVVVTNKESNNLHAEILLRILGVKFGASVIQPDPSKPAAWPPPTVDDLGSRVVRDYLKRIGADNPGLSFKDGSGLSRRDMITPATTVALLMDAANRPWGAALLNSLPIAGVDGTLQRRFAKTVAASNLRAKTGTLSYVSALSGYVTTAAGQKIVFSLMVNNQTRDISATRTMDAICVALAEFRGKL